MNYLEKIKKYWSESKIIKDNPYLQNYLKETFDLAIFNLVHKFLNTPSNGPSFIEVPSKELGSTNYSKNYENFCEAVLIAATEFALDPAKSRVAQKDTIQIGENFLHPRKGKVMRMVSEVSIREVAKIGTRDNSVIRVNNGYTGIKLLQDYNYNGLNGQRALDGYIGWLKETKKITEKNILLSEIRILIISHAEIEKSNFFRIIPTCSIKEDGIPDYSSPVPPFIYLARDYTTSTVKELVSQEFFDIVIMLGDKKISTSDEWAIANNYFKRAIYIGNKSPYPLNAYNDTELSSRNFTFGLSELHEYFGVRTKIQLELKEYKNTGLSNLINDFYSKLKEIDINLNFDLSIFMDLTAAISEGQKDSFLDYFDQKLITEGNYERDYAELKDKFQDILDYLGKEGNAEKLKTFNQIKSSKGKKEEVYAVVHDKYEIENLSDQLNIPESRILTLKNFGRKLRAKESNILESKKEMVFVFMSLPYAYQGSILEALDRFNVGGRRVFLTSLKKNPRIVKVLNARNLFNKSKMQNPVREEITGIEFQEEGIFEEIDQTLALTSINDLDLNEYVNFAIKPKTYQRQHYDVQLQDHHESYHIAGKVVDAHENELIDLSEVKVGDHIIFYRHHTISFEAIWELMYPGFSEDIQKYSEIMRDIIKEILAYYQSDFDRLYNELRNRGLRTSFNSITRLANDEVTTLFPRLDTLNALKFFCERTDEFKNHPFVKEFQMILKAKKGVELKKKLGNRLSNSLLDSYCDFEIEDFELNKIFTDRQDLLNQAKENCIVSGVVKKIKEK